MALLWRCLPDSGVAIIPPPSEYYLHRCFLDFELEFCPCIHLAPAGETADDRSSSPAKHVCGSGDDGPAYGLCGSAICYKLIETMVVEDEETVLK